MASEQLFKQVAGERLAEEIALSRAAYPIGGWVWTPSARTRSLSPWSHGDNSDGDRLMFGFGAQVLHKCAVDLDGIDREPLERG